MQGGRTFLERAGTGPGLSVREVLAQPAAPFRRFLMESPPGPETTIDGRRLRSFGDTSYHTLHYVGAGPAGVLRVAFSSRTGDRIDRLPGTLAVLV
jgi:hypothetical protein